MEKWKCQTAKWRWWEASDIPGGGRGLARSRERAEGGAQPSLPSICIHCPPSLHQSHIKKRLFMFRFGDRRTRMNWVHVRNLVQAHVLAAEALTAAKGYVAVSLP